MKETRDVAHNHRIVGAYATGVIYPLYDQLVAVGKYLWPSLGMIAVVVFFSSVIFIFHPIAALIMLVCLAATIFEIYGFLRWAGVKINPPLALNMIVAVGVSVEFTAHINRHFMLASGEPQYRMAASLGHMFL